MNRISRLLVLLSFLIQTAYFSGVNFERNDQISSYKDENQELRFLRLELLRSIKALIAKELNLPNPSNLVLSHYEIKNWPPFVPLAHKNWDEQAINQLFDALPKMKIKPRNLGPKESNDSEARDVKVYAKKILNDLLKRYNDQMALNAKRISWSKCNIEGWPVGVRTATNNFNSTEVLAISRQFYEINFLPLTEEQIKNEESYVIYSDGTRKIIKKGRHQNNRTSSSSSSSSSDTNEFDGAALSNEENDIFETINQILDDDHIIETSEVSDPVGYDFFDFEDFTSIDDGAERRLFEDYNMSH